MNSFSFVIITRSQFNNTGISFSSGATLCLQNLLKSISNAFRIIFNIVTMQCLSQLDCILPEITLISVRIYSLKPLSNCHFLFHESALPYTLYNIINLQRMIIELFCCSLQFKPPFESDFTLQSRTSDMCKQRLIFHCLIRFCPFLLLSYYSLLLKFQQDYFKYYFEHTLYFLIEFITKKFSCGMHGI